MMLDFDEDSEAFKNKFNKGGIDSKGSKNMSQFQSRKISLDFDKSFDESINIDQPSMLLN